MEEKEQKKSGGCFKTVCWLFVVFMCLTLGCSLIASLLGISDSNTPSTSSDIVLLTEPEMTLEELLEEARQDSIREANASYWRYDQDKDEMTDKKTYLASIVSENRAYFDFPYDGGSTLVLTLRQHPQWGKSVYIQISKGQFTGTYGGETIKVRFDDKPAKTFYLNEPSDYDSSFRFIRNGYSTFLSELKKAKVCKIQASFYNEGTHIFTFKVQNFDEDRYLDKPKKESKKLTADGTLK